MIDADQPEELAGDLLDREIDEPPPGENGQSDELAIRVPQVLAVVGLSMMGLFVLQIAAKLVHWLDLAARSPHAITRSGWRFFSAIVYSENQLYVIVGASLVLIAIHITGRKTWNRFIPAIKVFAVILVVMALVGLVGLFYVGHSEDEALLTWTVPSYVAALLVQMAAFSAIFLIESHELRRRLGEWFRRLLHKGAPEEEIPEEE